MRRLCAMALLASLSCGGKLVDETASRGVVGSGGASGFAGAGGQGGLAEQIVAGRGGAVASGGGASSSAAGMTQAGGVSAGGRGGGAGVGQGGDGLVGNEDLICDLEWTDSYVHICAGACMLEGSMPCPDGWVCCAPACTRFCKLHYSPGNPEGVPGINCLPLPKSTYYCQKPENCAPGGIITSKQSTSVGTDCREVLCKGEAGKDPGWCPPFP